MVNILKDPVYLEGLKIDEAGLVLNKCLDKNTSSVWYEAELGNHDKRIVYIYMDMSSRDKHKTRIHDFETSIAITLQDPSIVLYGNIGGYQIMMSRAQKQRFIDPTTRPKDISGFEIIDYLGEGYKGVTFKVRRKEGTRTPYALKLTIAEEYRDKSPIPEIDIMVDLALNDRDHFPQVHECNTWKDPITGEEFIYFVEDFIPGETLKNYLENNRDSLTSVFLDEFLREMLSALTVMQNFDLMHDDLHSGNIMIRQTLTGWCPVLIDFGSAKKRNHTKKPRDDIRNLASHIANIVNIVQLNSAGRSTYEDYVITACDALLATISDDDPLRRPDDPGYILEHFEANFPKGQVQQKLLQPFDFGNAEEVTDNNLLYQLSTKRFPWRDKIDQVQTF